MDASNNTQASGPSTGGARQTDGKRIRLLDPQTVKTHGPKSSVIHGATMNDLPAVALIQIVAFTECSSLSGVCRVTLEAIRELHYNINFRKIDDILRREGGPRGTKWVNHMGVQPSGALATGRIVTQITIRNCCAIEMHKEAVKSVVRHSIPTLRSIYIAVVSEPDGQCNNSPSVADFFDALVPRSTKRCRVAPNLTRVMIPDGATAVPKAGRAIQAGLWPALEVLDVSHCHANAGHFQSLAHGLAQGQAPKLRVLKWDDQTLYRKKSLDVTLLSALSAGKCPLIECLSFTGNRFCAEYRISCLGSALRACSNLRELLMDTSRWPSRDIQDMTTALNAGYAPHLSYLFMRSTKAYNRIDRTREGVEELMRASAARSPPIRVNTEIKTGYAKRGPQPV